MYIELSKVKTHLNIDKEYDEENDYLIHLIRSAEDATAKALNVKNLSVLLNNQGSLPEDVIHSMLLLIGSWYSTRETFSNQSVNKLPYSYEFLQALNRSYKTVF